MFYAVSLLVFAIDRAIKVLVSSKLAPLRSIPAIKNIIHFTYVQNTGVAFGLFRGQRFWLILAGIAICVVILYSYAKIKHTGALLKVSLAMILGGSLGNLYDRIVHGFVVDYIDLRFFPVFNFADIMINIGIFLILAELFIRRKDAPRPF